jgi:hypothetical protein
MLTLLIPFLFRENAFDLKMPVEGAFSVQHTLSRGPAGSLLACQLISLRFARVLRSSRSLIDGASWCFSSRYRPRHSVHTRCGGGRWNHRVCCVRLLSANSVRAFSVVANLSSPCALGSPPLHALNGAVLLRCSTRLRPLLRRTPSASKRCRGEYSADLLLVP